MRCKSIKIEKPVKQSQPAKLEKSHILEKSAKPDKLIKASHSLEKSDKKNKDSIPQLRFPPLNQRNAGSTSKPKTSKRNKHWVTNMPPTLGYNTRTNSADFPEYDEQKFLIYSVFREKILDKIVKEQLKDIASQAIQTAIDKKEKRRINKEIRSQERIKSREYVNNQETNEFDDGTKYPELPGFSVVLERNHQKKHMLDLMMQKKMTRRKKNIIKIYGKDMLAEMY